MRASRPFEIRHVALRLAAAALAVGACTAVIARTPEVTLIDPQNGEVVRIEAGAPLTHLVFFATWCPPCLDELRPLAELDSRWQDRGYRLIVVAVETRHSMERLQRFTGERRVPGRFLFDSDGSAQAAYAATDLPTHVLIDGTGNELLRAPEFAAGVAAEVDRILLRRERTPEQRP